jgi:Caspase domain
MFLRRCILVLALKAMVVVAVPVRAEDKRIALLIGNEAYASQIGHLANPHNDVALLEQALKSLGFEVVTVRDAGLATLYQVVNGPGPR